MRALSLAVAVLAVVSVVVYWKTGAPPAALLAGFAMVCAYTTFRSSGISTFLKIFVTIFSTETVIFGGLSLLTVVGAWPDALSEYRVPNSVALTVAMFSILVWAVSHVPVVRSIAAISDHYFMAEDRTEARIWPFARFRCSERTLATAMVTFLVVLNQAQVGISVRLSFFNRDWFNAIQNKDEASFWSLLFTVFLFWVVIYIASAIVEIVVQAMLTIRWRRYLTNYFISRWLDGATHYRMSLRGGAADNPDQRIAEDVNRFIDGGNAGYGVYSYSILLISTLSSLVSFAVILWTLSADFTIPRTDIAVPGFLFWVALIYSAVGTLITHLIGRSLVGLSFQRQRYEADFRFSLARLREYSEQVALLKGETAERQVAMGRFSRIYDNFVDIMRVRKKLTAFTATYGQISPFIPYIVAAPFYFAGKIQLGVMSQTAGAFGRVESALNFFVTYYSSLADFKAVLDRLTGFDDSIDRAKAISHDNPIVSQPTDVNAIAASHLAVALPDGREILDESSFEIPAHHATLVSGPSGSGKSTLFRAISGLWPYGRGLISTPTGARVMLLPQKPYIPIGTLRAAVAYPSEARAYPDDVLKGALETARLGNLVGRLDEEDNWTMRLSGGEQQRLAVARALLAKPDWLFLDEATAALDEESEAALYAAFKEKLPDTTIVSIGHRSTLNAFHERRIDLKPDGKGAFMAAEGVVDKV
jgi:putative ATP-binding cassette transporter